MTDRPEFERLRTLRERARLGGGQERIDAQHERGKLTARERLDILLDAGSFQELDMFVQSQAGALGADGERALGDGVVTGFGAIDGRKVCVFAQDFTVFGGSLAQMHAQKICKVMDLAMENGLPVIGLNDSGGARIQEGVVSLGGYADLFLRNTLASGVVPQLSVILGPCAGGAVYSPAITDFVFMVEGVSYMFVTGPEVVKTVTHEEVDRDALGGARVHAETSGVAHFLAANEAECLAQVRRLLSYLPANNLEDPPRADPAEPPPGSAERLDAIVPADAVQPYDMTEVVRAVADGGEFFQVHEHFARNLFCGFGRLGGRSVGFIGQQPAVLAGVLDIQSSMKGARFVRFCDAFNIPIITFEDVPGFLPGTHQEHGGIIKHGAKLLYAYCEATVPKITVITRKAYGGAYDVMGSKHVRADLNFAWPMAEIAVMGAEGAVEILFRKEIAAAKDPKAERAQRIADYRAQFYNPYIAAAYGFIDEVIEPHETRAKLLAGLALLENKRDTLPQKKHGNIPL